MESHPQNPEFRNNPENFHPCILLIWRSGYKKNRGKSKRQKRNLQKETRITTAGTYLVTYIIKPS